MALTIEPVTHAFRARATELVARHPVVTDNRYTAWFAQGEAGRGEVRHLTVQFSVFSHLFVEAQLRKVINAADLDTYRAGKEILLNELGVVFNVGGRAAASGDAVRSIANHFGGGASGSSSFRKVFYVLLTVN